MFERERRGGIRLGALGCALFFSLVLPGEAAERDSGYKVPEAPPYCTAHFCVHYVREGPDAPSLRDTGGVPGVPDFVEAVGQAAELARGVENGRLHWRGPVGDGGRGGGHDLTDVYTVDLSDFANGTVSFDAGQRGLRRSGYIELHRGLPIERDNAASVWPTVAHEYNHVLQDAYDAHVGGWMAESTAAWMADQVFPNNSIFNMEGWVRQTRLSITEGDPRRLYGTAAWNHWLASRYGVGVIRKAWAALAKVKPKHFEPAAYDRAIHQSRGPASRASGLSFPREFALFAATSAEWRARGFAASRFYPDILRGGTLTPGPKRKRRLDHTAYVLLDVPPASARKLVLKASVQRGTKSAVGLVARLGSRDDGHVTSRLRYLPRGGPAQVTLEHADRFDRITAVLVNADPSQRGYLGGGDWRWTRDHRVFTVQLTEG